jgi:hypothetical protein
MGRAAATRAAEASARREPGAAVRSADAVGPGRRGAEPGPVLRWAGFAARAASSAPTGVAAPLPVRITRRPSPAGASAARVGARHARRRERLVAERERVAEEHGRGHRVDVPLPAARAAAHLADRRRRAAVVYRSSTR